MPDTGTPAPQAVLRGSFSADQIRRWALAGLGEAANNAQLIALLKHHGSLCREVRST